MTITICGHGSGNPSTKNLTTYCNTRYNSYADNGKRKQIIAVKRLKALTDDERQLFHDYFKTRLGLNIYNQSLRSYVYSAYSNGKYYSDCSSIGCATFKKIGHSMSLLNTAGIYQSSLFEDVDVTIENGQITNPEILKTGDALLFVGNDPSRPLQIGHVEYVYEIDGEAVPSKYTAGWHKDDIGGWWYADSTTTYLKSCWQKIESAVDGNYYWYHFNSEGYLDTGWFQIDSSWFYAEESGDFEGALWHEASAKDGSLERWIVG